MQPVRIKPKTPPKRTAPENDAYAMCVCRQCGTAVSPLDSTLPCPGCGGMSYRRVSYDTVTTVTQQTC